jgi:hypothetical protein
MRRSHTPRSDDDVRRKPHNRQRSQCKECGGGSICEHNRVRSCCKDCRAAKAAAEAKGEKFTQGAPGAPWCPAELYNGMLRPLMPYAIAGAIWYQGESNAGRAWQYRSLFADMIRNWRRDWNQGDFPFLAVQLAPWDKNRKRSIADITAYLKSL